MKYLLFSLSVLVLSLTACESTETTKPNQTNPQQEIILDKPVLQEEVTFDDKIQKPLKQLLIDYDWTLENAVTKGGEIDNRLMIVRADTTLGFSDGGVGLSVGCNTMGTSLDLQNDVLSLGDFESTLMLCHDPLGKAENTMANYMVGESKLSAQVDKSNADFATLTVTAEEGTLTWKGKIKPDVKYGKGEMISWEVSNEMVACPNSPVESADGKCLKLRELHYDNDWNIIDRGEWKVFEQEVQGYEHDERYLRRIHVKKYLVDGKELYIYQTTTSEKTIRYDK